MLKEEIYNFCKSELGIVDIKVDESMKNHTTFKIGGKADIFIKISDLNTFIKLLKFVKENNIELIVIGNGSNILVKDNGIRGIVVKLDFKNIKTNKITNEKVEVTVGAGVSLGFLAQYLLKESISGFEFASGIPGTIGGAVRMNAGAYGSEFKDIVIETKCIDEDGNIKVLKNIEQNFSYRHSIFSDTNLYIIETKLSLNYNQNSDEILQKMEENSKLRKTKQPIGTPNAGSTFKRGDDFITAQLIDKCGLKGFSIGGAQVSDIHAGFIINTGNATAEDVLNLVDYVKEQVFKKFNKNITLEIEVLGE